MSTLFLGLKQALRGLRRGPGWALALLVSLALGVGASTAVFSALRSGMLARLPWKEPGRLVVLSAKDARSLSLGRMDGGFFHVLGATPRLGRLFGAGEADVVVLSHALWREAFGADPSVLRRSLQVGARSCTVVGVLGPEAAFRGIEAFVPLVPEAREAVSEGNWLFLVGRRHAGVSLEALGRAWAELDARDPRLMFLAATALLVASLLACLLPALRAARVQPAEALRSE